MDNTAGHASDPSDATPARLSSLVVVADDPVAMAHLLVDVLGGSRGGDDDGGGCTVRFAPGVTVELVASSSIDPGDPTWADAGEGLHRLRFEVDDPEAVAARLATVGYRRAEVAGPVIVHAPSGMGGAFELLPRSGAQTDLPVGDPDALVRRIDHVCSPSADLRRSYEVYGEILGGVPVFGGDAPQLGVLTVQTKFDGGMKVETLQPTGPDAAVGRFAERHPGRFHHLTMLVDDVPDAERRLAELGWETVDTDIVSDPDWHETYLRPARTARVLIQLGATGVSFTERLDDETMEKVFAGAIDVQRYVMVPK